MKEAALEYARRDIPLLPLVPRSKRPLTRHGLFDASTDLCRIEQWWTECPEANIGMPCGPSTWLVLDVDARHGGIETLASLETRFGLLPTGPVTLTGGGGKHCFFQCPPDPPRNRVSVFSGLDVRSAGGYVVLPPSLHESGVRYEFAPGRSLFEVSSPSIPDWLLKPMATGNKLKGLSGTLAFQNFERVPEGRRNDLLVRLTGYLLRYLPKAVLVPPLVHAFNESYCDPPLARREVDSLINNIAKRELRRRAE